MPHLTAKSLSSGQKCLTVQLAAMAVRSARRLWPSQPQAHRHHVSGAALVWREQLALSPQTCPGCPPTSSWQPLHPLKGELAKWPLFKFTAERLPVKARHDFQAVTQALQAIAHQSFFYGRRCMDVISILLRCTSYSRPSTDEFCIVTDDGSPHQQLMGNLENQSVAQRCKESVLNSQLIISTQAT